MAHDFASFTKELEGFVQATEEAMTGALRDIVVKVGTTVINFSPVLTGRFKGNWQMTVGSPSKNSLNVEDPDGAETIADLKIMASTLNPGEIAYIVNNITYGYNIETIGWAQTPPYMPVQRTLSEFTELVNEAIIKNRVKG